MKRLTSGGGLHYKLTSEALLTRHSPSFLVRSPSEGLGPLAFPLLGSDSPGWFDSPSDGCFSLAWSLVVLLVSLCLR